MIKSGRITVTRDYLAEYAPNTAAVLKAYEEDPITLLDDLSQFFENDGHSDLASEIHSILCVLDERLHAARRSA